MEIRGNQALVPFLYPGCDGTVSLVVVKQVHATHGSVVEQIGARLGDGLLPLLSSVVPLAVAQLLAIYTDWLSFQTRTTVNSE
jgi:hypothetical protein